MKTKVNPVCRNCGAELNDDNWYPSYRERNKHICKNCHIDRVKQWKKANPGKVKAQWARANRKRGQQPMNENKKCPAFLGVYVAEQVLSHVFKNVVRMPYGNHGYDFKCSNGFLIDVKGSCLHKNGSWHFDIRHNLIADYFLCLAFDNREDLNPLHAWLLPGDKFNHYVCPSISLSTVHKWDVYMLDISKVTSCCNILKEASANER